MCSRPLVLGVLVFWGVLRNLSLEVGGVTKFVTCETQNEIRGGVFETFQRPPFFASKFLKTSLFWVKNFKDPPLENKLKMLKTSLYSVWMQIKHIYFIYVEINIKTFSRPPFFWDKVFESSEILTRIRGGGSKILSRKTGNNFDVNLEA